MMVCVTTAEINLKISQFQTVTPAGVSFGPAICYRAVTGERSHLVNSTYYDYVMVLVDKREKQKTAFRRKRYGTEYSKYWLKSCKYTHETIVQDVK